MSAHRRCPCGVRQAPRRGTYCDAGCAKYHSRRRAVELAAEARADLDLTTNGYTRTAEYASTCPVCGRFIRAGSRIVALDTPSFPCVPLFDDDGNPRPRRRYRWIHNACADRSPDRFTIERSTRA